MALIKCPECGRDVSDSAVSCPHCGHPISSNNKTVVQLDSAPGKRKRSTAADRCNNTRNPSPGKRIVFLTHPILRGRTEISVSCLFFISLKMLVLGELALNVVEGYNKGGEENNLHHFIHVSGRVAAVFAACGS